MRPDDADTSKDQEHIDRILAEWFGELDAQGLADEAHVRRWFTKDPAFDEFLRETFGALVEAALAGDLDAWAATPRGALARILLLDQMTRNIFRDTPKMFAGDALGRAATEAAIAAGFDERLRPHERAFLYMPLMHAEDLAVQERCVACFESLARIHETFAGQVDYAEQHRDIVARFGRFPHRNELLGRASTDEERAFLKEPGSSF